MRRDRRLLAAQGLGAALAAVFLLAFAVAAVALLGAVLGETAQVPVREALTPHLPLMVLLGAGFAGAGAGIGAAVYRRYVAPPAQLLEQAQLLASSEVTRTLEMPGAGGAVPGLARVLNELVAQREQLRAEMAAQVAEASRGVEQERNRLAALMSELTQSVVVCNLDGRILLYNNRARMQFRALSAAPSLADGAELIGLGRSIYGVFDRRLVAHALESVQQRLQRGVASPSAQFVTTTRSGQLLRVQMAPVRGVAAADGPAAPVTGFVLMLDNITRAYEEESARERLLHGMTEGSRGSLANLRAAVEMLDEPDLEPAMRERFLAVVRDEAGAMSRRVQELAEQGAAVLATRWPLAEMLGSDFVQAAQRRIETTAGLRTGASDVDGSLWLQLDSFALLQALAYLSLRLKEEYSVRTVQLRLAAADGRKAQLDLVWPGVAMSTETVMSWETDPISTGADASALTVRDVVQRHGGEFWFERERTRQQAFFRFLLPLAPSAAEQEATEQAFVRGDSRPEYYDFDLFASTDSARALDDRPLSDLTYTVFDTETTGLNPSEGDEIIQIGAARLVNGRLLRHECFEQLVDPRRSIPAAGIAIHGITPEMVAGKPTIAEILPAFHAYAQDTVLVAHNAAFDMRFLQLQEERTGLRFDQPVLDTLLLSAVVHPNQESHRLEAIAERMGLTIIGRHTALGDAMVTAEVFQRLIPLLAEQGIRTLGQAREAARRTYFQRLSY